MMKSFYTACSLLLLTCFVTASWSQLDESKLTWKPDRGVSLNGYSNYYEVEPSSDFDVFAITV